MSEVVPAERIERMILLIRGQKVLLDSDLAKLYGVSTKALNRAVKATGIGFQKISCFNSPRASTDL